MEYFLLAAGIVTGFLAGRNRQSFGDCTDKLKIPLVICGFVTVAAMLANPHTYGGMNGLAWSMIFLSGYVPILYITYIVLINVRRK